MLLALIISANLIYLIVNQWVETQNPMLSLKKPTSFKYQIIALLNLKEVLDKDLAVNRRDQRIRFYNIVVLSISNVASKFAMDKS